MNTRSGETGLEADSTLLARSAQTWPTQALGRVVSSHESNRKKLPVAIDTSWDTSYNLSRLLPWQEFPSLVFAMIRSTNNMYMYTPGARFMCVMVSC